MAGKHLRPCLFSAAHTSVASRCLLARARKASLKVVLVGRRGGSNEVQRCG